MEVEEPQEDQEVQMEVVVITTTTTITTTIVSLKVCHFITCHIFQKSWEKTIYTQHNFRTDIQEENEAFEVCDFDKDGALTWPEVEECEVCTSICTLKIFSYKNYVNMLYQYRKSFVWW